MPNWVYNVFTVTGEKQELQAFKHRAVGCNRIPGEPPSVFSFDSLVPMPQEIIEGSAEDYRKWVYQNWGCRGAGDCRLETETEDMLIYFFETPNDPPKGLMLNLGRKWPNLRFTDSFHEFINIRVVWLYEVQGESFSEGPAYIVDAVKTWREEAEEGYASAQYDLGVCFINGMGVKKDMAEAVKWWTKAAQQGHPAAVKALKEVICK